MRETVAVDEGLANVRFVLEAAGYSVVGLTSESAADAAAVVLAGSGDDMVGINRTQTRAAVIAARGLTEQEVLEQVRSRLRVRPSR